MHSVRLRKEGRKEADSRSQTGRTFRSLVKLEREAEREGGASLSLRTLAGPKCSDSPSSSSSASVGDDGFPAGPPPFPPPKNSTAMLRNKNKMQSELLELRLKSERFALVKTSPNIQYREVFCNAVSIAEPWMLAKGEGASSPRGDPGRRGRRRRPRPGGRRRRWRRSRRYRIL